MARVTKNFHPDFVAVNASELFAKSYREAISRPSSVASMNSLTFLDREVTSPSSYNSPRPSWTNGMDMPHSNSIHPGSRDSVGSTVDDDSDDSDMSAHEEMGAQRRRIREMASLHPSHQKKSASNASNASARNVNANASNANARIADSRLVNLLKNDGTSNVIATFEAVSKYFDLPLKHAAEKFGVRATAFKKRCRAIGIAHWPYRKVRSLKRSIQELEKCKAAGNISVRQEQQLEAFEQQLQIMLTPSTYGIGQQRITTNSNSFLKRSLPQGMVSSLKPPASPEKNEIRAIEHRTDFGMSPTSNPDRHLPSLCTSLHNSSSAPALTTFETNANGSDEHVNAKPLKKQKTAVFDAMEVVDGLPFGRFHFPKASPMSNSSNPIEDLNDLPHGQTTEPQIDLYPGYRDHDQLGLIDDIHLIDIETDLDDIFIDLSPGL